MAKKKAKTVKTVKARVVVFYDGEGRYMAGGNWDYSVKGQKFVLPSENRLLELSDELNAADLPHACIVEIELPIPGPLVGKVVKVKAVKR